MLERIRQFFIFGNSAPKLYFLAILTGLLSSLVVILFRLFIQYGQNFLFHTNHIDSFSGLSWQWVLLLPITGGLLVGLLFSNLDSRQHSFGIVHVIARLSYHEGRMPWQNMVRQFLGAGIAIISGHSVGKEGPSVHLGAGSGSRLAMSLDLPNNGVRTLVACGTAAAIASSFNTPIAGVIFAMEVVMMEYFIASFIPIILAAVSGTFLSHLVFGDTAIFGTLGTQSMHSLVEIPYIILTGLVIGLVSSLFMRSHHFFSHTLTKHPFWLRCTYAGILIGIAGLFMPELMGTSYGIIHDIATNNATVWILILLCLLKLFLSSACLGLGIPGGFIGPSLVIGACAGGALGIIGALIFPDQASSVSFYAMLGMCAMMGSTLKAPLAALMAMLELSNNVNIILPGMLVIVFSSLLIHDLFKHESFFMGLLHDRGLDYQNDPITQTLRHISVAEVMQRKFVSLSQQLTRQQATEALKQNPEWILITKDRIPMSLMPASELARALTAEEDDTEQAVEFDLMAIPANRRDVHKIYLHASLNEAMQALKQHDVEALYVSRITAPMIERTYGIITHEHIQSHYHPPQVMNS